MEEWGQLGEERKGGERREERRRRRREVRGQEEGRRGVQRMK